MNHGVMPLCVPVAPAQVEGGSLLRSAGKTLLEAFESRGEGGELPKVWVLSAGTTEATFILYTLCFACSHPGLVALWAGLHPGFFSGLQLCLCPWRCLGL